MILYCASTNPGKLREFNLIAEHYAAGQLEVRAVPGLAAIAAPEETGDSFAANASLKADYYSRLCDGLLFADDSGLAVDSLGGAPGIFSARFAGEHATDQQNNERVVREAAPFPDRTAHFICAIAVARRGSTVQVFEDRVTGRLLDSPQGPNGFGYDPLFFYEPFGATFGETPAERKLLVSHRGKAMARMIRWILANGSTVEGTLGQ
ncbi:MAG TPA: RdgB/HAM1 family non-canonical purine NTP pyrophosphatase [Bryobacteraceae bacterium]|nr:RdgB/HAM1 family non-canonical purine NTP pyrophosphatase [Bryobacteraceae bacterium]